MIIGARRWLRPQSRSQQELADDPSALEEHMSSSRLGKRQAIINEANPTRSEMI
jgi:hypothetical protein